jgi:hypothetical protein
MSKPKRGAARPATDDATEARAREPNTTQLRARMPSARTVTIDSAHEPSAASFDTDDEAAGRPAQGPAIRQALEHEGRAPAQPPGSAARAGGALAAVWIGLAVAGLVVMAWVVFS